jgi:hypothetical protein
VPEPDVESEIYEHLYGLPRRDRRNGKSAESRIVIADRPLRPDAGDLEPLAVAHAPVRRPRVPHVDIGHLAGAAGQLLAAAAAVARGAMGELRPVGDRALAAAWRHPAPATALVWALLAVPVVALLLPAGGAGAVTTRLRPGAPAHFAIPATTASPTPAPAAHKPAPPPTTTADATASTAVPASQPTTTTPAQRRSNTTPFHRRSTTPRRRTTVATPRPTPPIQRPTSQQAPSRRTGTGLTPSPPPRTTPTTPGGTGATPDPTGGQQAPGN